MHTPADIAEKLNVSRMTVYRLIQTRAIASLRIGRHFRVSPEALQQFIDSNTQPPHNPEAAPVRQERTCQQKDRDRHTGGSVTSTQAEQELDALLKPATSKQQKPSKTA
jgi:excisionase family DNA binding protein